MNYDDNIKLIYEALLADGVMSTFDFTKKDDDDKLWFLNETLGLNAAHPEIVPTAIFRENENPTLYSGSINIEPYREQFTHGVNKLVEQHLNGSSHGYGYYFTPQNFVADFYTRPFAHTPESTEIKGGVITVKQTKNSKFALYKDIFDARPERKNYYITPFANAGLKKDVATQIIYDYHKGCQTHAFLPTAAAAHGFDGIKFGEMLNPYDHAFVIANRQNLITPEI